jgi:hypothetical protein
MRRSKAIQFNGKEVEVSELTVTQVDSLLADSDSHVTTVEMLLNPNIPISAVVAATGISSNELNGDIAPSELQKLWEAVEEINPFLLQMYTRLVAAASAVNQDLDAREIP